MKKKRYYRYRLARKLMVLVAAAPLFQLTQCQTFSNQVFANVVNSLPSAIFQSILNFSLLPIQILLGGGGQQGTI